MPRVHSLTSSVFSVQRPGPSVQLLRSESRNSGMPGEMNNMKRHLNSSINDTNELLQESKSMETNEINIGILDRL